MAGKGKDDEEGKRVLQQVGAEFDSMAAGADGDAMLGDGLSAKPTAPKPKVNPSNLRGLDQMTSNLKFAEALTKERRQLDASTRSQLEGVIGRSLDEVSIYSGKYVDAAAKTLGAEAFAVGKHIFLRQDKFSTSNSEGVALMAHELTHAFQDESMSVAEKEIEAHKVEAEVASGSMDLALEQAPASGISGGLISESSSAASGAEEAAPVSDDRETASTATSPDRKEVEELLVKRVIEIFRQRVGVDLERHGFNSY